MRERPQESTKESINPTTETVRLFENWCRLKRYDAEVRLVPDTEGDVSIFLYNDNGNLAQTVEPYQELMNACHLDEKFVAYNLDIKTWNELPYLSVTK